MAVQFDAVKEMTDSVSIVFQRRNWLLGAPVLAGLFVMYVVIIVVGLIVMGPQWLKTIASGGSQTPDITPAFAVGFAIGMTVFVLFVLEVFRHDGDHPTPGRWGRRSACGKGTIRPSIGGSISRL